MLFHVNFRRKILLVCEGFRWGVLFLNALVGLEMGLMLWG